MELLIWFLVTLAALVTLVSCFNVVAAIRDFNSTSALLGFDSRLRLEYAVGTFVRKWAFIGLISLVVFIFSLTGVLS